MPADQDALELAAADRARQAFAVQYDLVGLPETDAVADVRARRAAGRPPGARNRRSEDVARAVIEQLGDPLVMQAAIATMPAEELAAAARCTLLEALVEKRLAAAVVLPYLHRKQPLAVSVDGRVVHLHISDQANPRAAGEAGEGGVVTIAGEVLDALVTAADESKENQGVSDGPASAV